MQYRSNAEKTDISDLGEIPNHFQIKHKVDHIKVLKKSDVFLTHCGMNSVNESLYYDVPMVLFPQHSEQGLVAKRTAELGAGLMLKGNKPTHIKDAIEQILSDVPFIKNHLDTKDPEFLAYKVVVLAAGIILYIVLTLFSYQRSVRSFEALDL